MSDRLLKESDVIREVESLLVSDEMRHLNDLEYGNNQALYHVIDRIEDLPSADKPQGEWAKRTHSTLIALVNFAYCSECGQPIMHEHTRPLWSYCPNCGAKMDGERKEKSDE